MTDYFELFGLERQPVLDGDHLRRRYMELSAAHHPDRQSSGPDTENLLGRINEGFRVLWSPALRLRHLLELEGWERPHEGPVGGTVFEEWFGEMGGLMQAADALVKKLEHASSAVGRAGLAPEVAACCGSLQELQKRLEEEETILHQRLEEAQQNWTRDRRAVLPELSELSMTLQFVERWLDQVRNRRHTLEQEI